MEQSRAVNAAIDANTTSYKFEDLEGEAGTSYAFQIVALGVENRDYADSELSEKFNFATQAILATPELIATANSDTEIALSWNPVANATGYTLTYGDKTQYLEASDTSFVAKGLRAGTEYAFAITATSEVDDYVNSTTANASATTLAKLATPELTVTEQTENSIKLNWTGIEGANGYTLVYSKSEDVAATSVPLVKGSTSYVATGLESGAKYVFQLVANGEAGKSVDSEPGATNEVATLVKINPPVNVTVVEQTQDSIKITWEGDPRATSYTVTYGLTGQTKTQTENVNAAEFELKDLGEVESYTFQIVANPSGEEFVSSDPATIKVATLGQLATPEVYNIQRSETTISFEWSAVGQATGYTLTYGEQGGAEKTFTLPATTKKYSFSKLDEGTIYTFKLSAESDGFVGSEQNVFDVTTHEQLAAPTITTTRTTDSIKLDWGVVLNASSYKLYRNDVEVYSGSARTYNSTGLEQGTEYTFKLKAIGDKPENVAQSYYLDSSSEIKVKTQKQLDAPKLEYVTRSLDNTNDVATITVGWNAVSDATSYILRYREDEGIWSSVDASQYVLQNNAYTCEVKNLATETTYEFEVIARGEPDADPNYVNSEAATITQVTQKQLDAPKLEFDARDLNSITVKWNAVDDETENGYTLGYRAGTTGEFTQVDSANFTKDGDAYTCVVSGLTEATSYQFQLIAKGTTNEDYLDSEAATLKDVTKGTLATPRNLAATHDMSSIALTWDAVEHATKYQVVFGVKDSVTTNSIEVTEPSFSMESLGPGVAYTFTITALGDENYYLASEAAETTAQTQAKLVASAPELQARATDSLTVTWEAVENATRYELYRDGVKVYEGSNTSYTDRGFVNTVLTPGASYVYEVVAVGDAAAVGDAGNYLASEKSTQATFVTQKRLDQPTLEYGSRTETSITVNWTAVANATGYKLEYRVKGATEWTTENVDGTSYDANGLTPATTYEFQLTAIGDGDPTALATLYLDSETSAILEKNTQATLDAPTLTLKEQSIDSITLSWNLIENATGYDIYKNNAKITTINSGETTSYVVTDLEAGGSYSYQIKAKGDSALNSSDPNFKDSEKSEALAINKLAKPTITVGETTNESIPLSWNTPTNATRTTLEYRVKPETETETAWTAVELAEGATSYTLTGQLGDATTYQFRVVAVGDLEQKLVSTATIEEATTKTKLATPTLTYVTREFDDQETVDTSDDKASISFTWVTAEHVDSYTLYYRVVGVEEWSTAPAIDTFAPAGETNSYKLEKLTPGANYEFQLVANGSGDYVSSDRSASITATTQAKLAQPTLKLKERTTGRITVQWNGNDNATGYALKIRQGDSQVFSMTLGAGQSEFGYNLSSGVAYTYELVAKGTTNEDYLDSEKATLTVATKSQLAAPTLTSAPGEGDLTKVTISWDAIDNATGYELYLNGEKVTDYDGTTLSYVKSGLEAGASYSFTVKAKGNDDGNVAVTEVPYVDSNVSSALVVTKLAKPTIAVGERTANSIAITWDEVANATGYEIYLGDTMVDSKGANAARSYTFTGLEGAKECNLKVVAVGNGTTFVSTDATETATTKTQLTASKPSLKSRTLSSDGTVATMTVSWSAVDHANGYALYLDGVAVNAALDEDATSYTFENLAAGKEYSIQLVAKGSGEYVDSEKSEALTQKTQAKLAKPSINVGERTHDSIALSWDSVANATSYKLTGYNNSNGSKVVEVTLSEREYTISGLAQGTEYSFTIEAVASSDDYVSNSSEREATTKTQLSQPVVTVNPSVDDNNAILLGKLTATWEPVNYATGYKVVCTDTQTQEKKEQDVDGTTTSFEGLENGREYKIEVVAKGAGEFVNSEAGFNTCTTAVQLDSPTIASVTRTTATITVNWALPTDATACQLYLYDEDGVEVGNELANADQTSYIFTKLPQGKKYTIKLYAVADGFVTSEAATQEVKTQKQLAMVTPEVRIEDDAILTWSPVENAGGYELKYRVKESEDEWQTADYSSDDVVTASIPSDPGMAYEYTLVVKAAGGDDPDYVDSDAFTGDVVFEE